MKKIFAIFAICILAGTILSSCASVRGGRTGCKMNSQMVGYK